MPDIVLRPRDEGRGTFDVHSYPFGYADRLIVARPADAGRGTFDVQLYPASLFPPAAAGGAFPTQYPGLRIRHSGVTYDLCLVATGDAPAGMGGQPRIRKGGTTYAIYLVETTDPNASPVRLRTSSGTKAIRLLT